MADEFHGNPRVWIVATILVPENVPTNWCSWILSLLVMILDFVYPEGVDLKAEEVKGDETPSIPHPGWKVVYLKWYGAPVVWGLPSGQPEGEFDPKDLLGGDEGDEKSPPTS